MSTVWTFIILDVLSIHSLAKSLPVFASTKFFSARNPEMLDTDFAELVLVRLSVYMRNGIQFCCLTLKVVVSCDGLFIGDFIRRPLMGGWQQRKLVLRGKMAGHRV